MNALKKKKREKLEATMGWAHTRPSAPTPSDHELSCRCVMFQDCVLYDCDTIMLTKTYPQTDKKAPKLYCVSRMIFSTKTHTDTLTDKDQDSTL